MQALENIEPGVSRLSAVRHRPFARPLADDSYLREWDGRSRRIAGVADRDLERRKWADSGHSPARAGKEWLREVGTGLARQGGPPLRCLTPAQRGNVPQPRRPVIRRGDDALASRG